MSICLSVVMQIDLYAGQYLYSLTLRLVETRFSNITSLKTKNFVLVVVVVVVVVAVVVVVVESS